MALIFWAAGWVALLGWCGRCFFGYFFAVRKALGRDPFPSLTEMFDTYFAELWPAFYKHQTDPAMEGMRRRMWIAFALWIGNGILGLRVWAAILGWI